MSYQRSPFREKQFNNDLNLTPKRMTYRNSEISYIDKQNPHRSSLNMNRKGDSNQRNAFVETNSKHITSQMITEYENEFNEKPDRQYKRQGTFEGDLDGHSIHSKSTFEEQKKFNAKHFQIESKISKIQSFHQKIENLLDMVNKKPKTPSKTSDIQTPLTPSKLYGQQLSSRSVSKISPLNLKQKVGIEGLNKQFNPREQRDPYQLKYGQPTQPNYYNRNNQEPFELISSVGSQSYDNGRVTSKFQDAKVMNRGENQFARENKYFPKERQGSIINAQEEFKQSARKKSKEYMKSIEGEVRDIQNTIELLNEKIKQVDQKSFKKQVAFDNLSTSNPESFSDNHEKISSQIQPIYAASRTPTRGYKQTIQNRYQKQTDTRNISNNNGYRKERSFRKTSHNGMATPTKYELSSEMNGIRNDRLSNPYDGDVEQSEERNRHNLMQEIRRKRN